MTYQDIYTEVVNTRFNGALQASAKNWVNLAYAKIWAAREWDFTWKRANVAITSGNATLGSLPADFSNVSYLWNEVGSPIPYLTPQEFFKTFYGSTDTGTPAYYTVVNGVITLGPTPNYSSSLYELVYQAKLVQMVNDSDVPALPVEYHYLLVHGALVIGLVMQNDFTYAMQNEMLNEGLQAMSSQYVGDYGGTLQYAADALGMVSSNAGI